MRVTLPIVLGENNSCRCRMRLFKGFLMMIGFTQSLSPFAHCLVSDIEVFKRFVNYLNVTSAGFS